MERKLNSITRYINEKLRIHLAISLGVFLFILFFQPFLLDNLDFNNRLIFIAGLTGIIFLLLLVIQLICFSRMKRKDENDIEPPSLVSDLIFMVLSSVAITFYLRYVGSNVITFYVVFKVIAICFILVMVIRLNNSFQVLRAQNELLISKLLLLQNQVDQFEEDNLNISIELISDNSNEKLNLLVSDIIGLQSADNYVSVLYKECRSRGNIWPSLKKSYDDKVVNGIYPANLPLISFP